MKLKSILMMALAAVLLSAGADVIKVETAPTVDGRLDEAFWAKAGWNGNFVKFANQLKDREVKHQTEFAIAADAKTVYIGVKCRESKMDALKALPPGSVWGADCLEIFLCPTGKSFDFYQFVVPYKTEVGTAQRFASEGGVISPDPYSAPWQVARSDTKEGWTAEIAIPLSSLYMTRNEKWSGEWLFNIARCSRTVGERTTWSPLKKANCEPESFNKVKGFPMRAAADDVGMTDVVAEIGGRKDGKLAGTLKFKAFAAEGGEFTVTSPNVTATDVTLKSGANTVIVPCAYAANGRHPTELTLVRKATGEKYSRQYPVIVDFEDIRVKLTSPEYRDNFYPGQDSSVVKGRVSVAAEGAVKLTLEGPGIPKTEKTLDGSGAFEFRTPDFAVGDAFLTVESAGAKKTVKIRKLAPTGHRMAWISKGRLVVDGKPVLRRGIYALGYHGGEAFKERFDNDKRLYLTPEANAGGGTLEPGRVIKGLESQEARKDVRPCAEYFKKIDAMIERNKDRDFVSYYISDEPECRGLSPVYLRHIYEYMKEKDPYHVISTASRGGKKYIDCADWFETHPYLCPYDDGKGNRRYGVAPNQMGGYLDAFEAWDRPDKCIGFLPSLFAYRFQSILNDYPTFPEYVCHVWAAMMRGGKTLYPYAYHDMGDRPAIYEGNRYVNSSFEALQEFVLDGKRTTLLKTPEAECVRWDLPNGEAMFVLVNMLPQAQTVSVPGLKGKFREFRGTRSFETGLIFGRTMAPFALEPFGVIVGTTDVRDAGLETYAEAKALVDRQEYERTHRDNQILEKYTEIDYASSNGGKNFYKLIDGVHDVWAWYQGHSKNPYVEFSFPEKPLVFSKVRVYGNHLEGLHVSIRKGGAWKDLTAKSVKTEKWMRELDFGAVESTVKIRLSFSDGKKSIENLELYEIEIPKVDAAAASVAKNAAKAAAIDIPVEANWCFDGSNADWQSNWSSKKWFGEKTRTVAPREGGGFVVSGKTTHCAAFKPEYPWIELEIDSFSRNDGDKGGYHAWWFRPNKFGSLFGTVSYPVAGLYTAKLPPFEKPIDGYIAFEEYNLDIGIVRLRNVKKPANSLAAEVVGNPKTAKPGDTVEIVLELAAPCEDLTAVLLCDHGHGGGLQGFSINGTNALELKAADESGRIWKASFPIKSCDKAKPRHVYVKCTTLGGALKLPILTSFACGFGAK